MLAAPGGLYLDVKSGYSKAQQLKWFASTLAGIGVNVKVRCLRLPPYRHALNNVFPFLISSQAICSFVPAQIDFASLKDTQPFGGKDPASQKGEKTLIMHRALLMGMGYWKRFLQRVLE